MYGYQFGKKRKGVGKVKPAKKAKPGVGKKPSQVRSKKKK